MSSLEGKVSNLQLKLNAIAHLKQLQDSRTHVEGLEHKLEAGELPLTQPSTEMEESTASRTLDQLHAIRIFMAAKRRRNERVIRATMRNKRARPR